MISNKSATLSSAPHHQQDFQARSTRHFNDSLRGKGAIDTLKQERLHGCSVIVNDNDYLKLANEFDNVFAEKYADYVRKESLAASDHFYTSSNTLSTTTPTMTKSQVCSKESTTKNDTSTHTNIVMSAMFLSEQSLQYRVSEYLGTWIRKSAVHICQSGYIANVGLLVTLTTKQTHVYIDQYAHMSLWKGVEHAIIHRIRHNDTQHLVREIQQHGPGVIVVDALYSTRGTFAPLEQLCDIRDKFQCTLVVDESHSLGLFGTNGAGIVECLGLSNQVDYIVGSLAKTLCCRAGFIACNNKKDLLFIRESCYHTIFSSAMMIYDLLRIQFMIRRVMHASAERARLQHICAKVYEMGKECGFRFAQDGVYSTESLSPYHTDVLFSPILCFVAGDESRLKQFQVYIENEHGIVGSLFITPATNKNRSLLRVTLHAGLSDDQIDKIRTCLRDIVSKWNHVTLPHLYHTKTPLGAKL